jgi:hypothetical protein
MKWCCSPLVSAIADGAVASERLQGGHRRFPVGLIVEANPFGRPPMTDDIMSPQRVEKTVGATPQSRPRLLASTLCLVRVSTPFLGRRPSGYRLCCLSVAAR